MASVVTGKNVLERVKVKMSMKSPPKFHFIKGNIDKTLEEQK